ncbi:MAG: methylmalonyl Co-A mutase-associated GTPase MeaB [Opitutaceae bacterium]|jgi:LAO/AO transport system kinase|nr:methylmalonyl Co-A mutase-associated GTPase MeaB [Opitutaceae bacterium]
MPEKPYPLHDGCPQPRPDWVPDDCTPESGFSTWIMQGVRPSGASVAGPPARRRAELSVADCVRGVRGRDPAVLGRVLSLVESNLPVHRARAQAVLAELMPHTGGAKRIGLTGIPGAGKSTFIEAFGLNLAEQGLRVAVLAIDPSSAVTGGSILADKVRMEKLGRHPNAFIRPSPSGGSLGGVARKTREAILVCEAAGYDVVLVETVGVGQNEVAVRAMVDAFVVLLIAGAGDELQGIKKGVIELADLLVINKADGENAPRCAAALAEMRRVLRYLRPATEGWGTRALSASALTGAGVADVWAALGEFFATARAGGMIDARRRTQAVEWMHALIEERLRGDFWDDERVRLRRGGIERAVADGRLGPLVGALELLTAAGR